MPPQVALGLGAELVARRCRVGEAAADPGVLLRTREAAETDFGTDGIVRSGFGVALLGALVDGRWWGLWRDGLWFCCIGG